MQRRNHSMIPTPRPSGFRVETRANLTRWALMDIRHATTMLKVRCALGTLHDSGIDSAVAFEAAKLKEKELCR